ncbi:cell division protein FtsA [Thermodesulfatator autotrophicus]|uniref:Cell division protein FtsA n=1 Tax=Thermodesulfatator autotrophicus TaxID=1795632 RepID=A0A177E7X2_9BACT|nr:cell division protein FtsA [Thermodesulfatator autotrophicus]OAG27995.1 cell division protein FtsA [Thermodesulfatator autotrophicus]
MIVGLDVGTTKVCCLAAEEIEGELRAIGLGMANASGLRRGVVVNIESTVSAIIEAVQQAEEACGEEITNVIVGIAGSHIRSQQSHGVIALKSGEVTEEDVQRVLEAAQAINLPNDRLILHAIPQEYIVDEQSGIEQPIGMSGVRLEAKVHIVTAGASAVHNLVKCVEKAGLTVDAVVLQPLASAHAVLTEEEKKLGVALIDFGGGTTDVAIFLEGNLRYTSAVGVGGQILTSDLTVGLRTTMAAAEKLKVHYGSCLAPLVPREEYIEVPGLGNRPARRLSRQVLAEILEPRVEELLEIINTELENSGLKPRLGSGAVITGGSSLLSGLLEMADQIFELPTRIGYPKRLPGLTEEVNHPRLATAVGLVLFGREMDLHRQKTQPKNPLKKLFEILGRGL